MAKVKFNINEKAFPLLLDNLFSALWINVLDIITQVLNIEMEAINIFVIEQEVENKLQICTKTRAFPIGNYIQKGDIINKKIADLNINNPNDYFIYEQLKNRLTNSINKFNQSPATKGIYVSLTEEKDCNLIIKVIPKESIKPEKIVKINLGPKVTDLVLCQKMLDLKRSADDRGIPFSLSFKKLKYLWSRPRCQITREPFNWVENSPSNPQWKSIDRWDNSKGYTDDNSIICSQRINTRKGNLSLEDLEFLFKFHQKRLKK